MKRRESTIKKYEALKGQRFGFLTVIEPVFSDEDYRIRIRCKCDCGNETIVQAPTLLNGIVKSCGCLLRSKPGRAYGLLGKKFGHLTVIGTAPNGRRSGKKVHVRCDCGTEKDILVSLLESGRSSTCGCRMNRQKVANYNKHPEELIGEKRGMLTLLEVLPPKKGFKNRGKRARCMCDCGNETILNLSAWKREEIRSCGCLRKKKDVSEEKPIVKEPVVQLPLVKEKQEPVTEAPVVVPAEAPIMVTTEPAEEKAGFFKTLSNKIKSIFGLRKAS